jgi:hypothetical protein
MPFPYPPRSGCPEPLLTQDPIRFLTKENEETKGARAHHPHHPSSFPFNIQSDHRPPSYPPKSRVVSASADPIPKPQKQDHSGDLQIPEVSNSSLQIKNKKSSIINRQ